MLSCWKVMRKGFKKEGTQIYIFQSGSIRAHRFERLKTGRRDQKLIALVQKSNNGKNIDSKHS